jgi:hypothetical protein
MVLFDGDRGAVFLRQADGKVTAEVTRGLSSEYTSAVRDFPARSLPSAAIAARRPLFATNYRDDPRGVGIRAAVVQEGYDTICTAPLLDGDHVLGLLNVYHDQRHEWTEDELDTIACARDAGQCRHPDRAELRSDGDIHRAAPVDPAARGTAQPPLERRGDRARHRYRASPAHRLPQRSRLPTLRR